MVLGCTAPCHVTQGGGIDGQLAAYFLLSLAVPSYSCSDRINESSRIPPGTNWQLTGGL